MQLIDRVRATIRAHDLARADTRVLVAVSGGSDSVALAYLLADLAARGVLKVAGLAHLNHQLRAAAVADEEFCGALAARLGWPFLSHGEDVAARARAERRSLEDAARAARYEFLEDARQRCHADVVALGHTRDDQAETLLLRLIRGAGARGLAGMHPRNGTIIRPLLECRRAELRAYLAELGVEFVHDTTNDDVSIPRNRVRAELLPLLERRFNPSIVDVLADEADIAREEWTWMDAAVREASRELVRHPDDRVWTVHAAGLDALPLALARMVVRGALVQAASGKHVSLHHVESALRLARVDAGRVDGPAVSVERVGDTLVLTSKSTPGGPNEGQANLFRYSLSIPGEVALAEAACVVSAEAAASLGSAVLSSSATGVVRLDRCRTPLAVRNRRPGDRFRPLGLGGRKKLQDYFVDKKVPRQHRDRVPLVVDENDRIIWVAGHGIDDEFRVTDSSQAVLILRLTQV
jgi:tRNA(Ile)-lysidine synthase